MKILTIPNPILNTPAKKVTRFDKKLAVLVQEMMTTLATQHDPEGVGLAAPQIGISWRLFVIKPKKDRKAAVLVNPEYVGEQKTEDRRQKEEKREKKNNDDTKLEGCLSIPRIWGQVERTKNFNIKYQDIKGNWIARRVSGFEAVVIQHEMDHLNGVLFTQRVLEQKGKLYREEKGELKRYEI